MSNSARNYWLRSNTERTNEDEEMSAEEFPPLPGTPVTPVEAAAPERIEPAAQPADAMDVLNTMQSTMTTITEQMSSLAEQIAALSMETQRSGQRLLQLERAQSVEPVSIRRTPRIERTTARRTLATSPATVGHESGRVLTTTRDYEAPSLTPAEEHKLVKDYNMKDLQKLMASHPLRKLQYEDWLRFSRTLTATLTTCNSPDSISKIFSLEVDEGYEFLMLANRRCFALLQAICSEGEVSAVVQRYQPEQDGRAAFLKLHDLCNTPTILSADVIRSEIQNFKFVETKPPNYQIQKLKELHEQLTLAQQKPEIDQGYLIESLMSRLQEVSIYKTRMTEFNLDHAAGFTVTEQEVISAAELIYVERNRPSSRRTRWDETNKVHALQHKPQTTEKKTTEKKTPKFDCHMCDIILNKKNQRHWPQDCPVYIEKKAERETELNKAAVVKTDEIDDTPTPSTGPRRKVHFSRRTTDATDEEDANYWEKVFTDAKCTTLKST